MSTQNLTEAFAVVEKLSPEEKLQLIEHVAHELHETRSEKIRHWREFRGLGKKIWQGVGSGMDALHVAAAIEAKADELVTTEKPTKPMHRVKEVKVVSLYEREEARSR